MAESDINTIPKLAQRAKADGLPISEYTIRRLIRQGALPARAIGRMQRTTSRTTLARRVPGGSTAMILFPDCATHDKGSASVHK